MLEQIGIYNDLSPQLRQKLEEKVLGFGKRVRYKFDISNPNPDPEKRNGQIIWPFRYSLTPVTFTVTDKEEKREGKQKVKRIGIVEGTDNEGRANRFRKVVIAERDKGILELDLEKAEDYAAAMFIELHPKLGGGLFADKEKKQVITRIDETQLATEKRTERTARLKALNAAQGMSDKEVVQFAAAMMWDDTEEDVILRSKIEEVAETTPEFFNDLIQGKTIEYRSTVKKAMDNKVIAFNAGEYKFVWVGNNQPITVLSPAGEQNEIEKMAEWLLTGGAKADEIYKKINSLLK